MGIDHRITRTSENFKGLDLRSSDIVRGQDFATDMRNASYRISGAINKRKGFQHKRSAGTIKGMTTFKNISSNGAVTDELIYVEDNNVKKEVQFDLVAYRSQNIFSNSVTIDISKTETNVNVQASDGSDELYYNETFASTDPLSSLTGDLLYNTSLPSGSGTKIIDWSTIDLSQCKLSWQSSLYEYEHTPAKFYDSREYVYLYIPVSQIDKTLIDSFLATARFFDDSNPRNTAHGFGNRLITFGGHNLLIAPNESINARGEISTYTPILPNFPASNTAWVTGYFQNNAEFISSTTHQDAEEWLRITIVPEWMIDPDEGRIFDNGLSWQTYDDYYRRSFQTTSNTAYLNQLWTWGSSSGYSNGELYPQNSFRHIWSWAACNLSNDEIDYNYVDRTGISAPYYYAMTLQNMLDGYNANIQYAPGIIGQSLDSIETLPFDSAAIKSDLTVELRNEEGLQVNQFLSENISSLNTTTTIISNNASSLFPTTVTTGSVEQTIDSLTWTSSDYDNILTENVNFASLNNVLYIANGVDNLMKYDGDNLYRAGLPNCKAEDFSLNSAALVVSTSTPDTTDSYLHNVFPGQVEYFTFDDSVYDNNSADPANPVYEPLQADYKYYLEFRLNGSTPQFRQKSGSITGSYGPFLSWSSLNTFGSTSSFTGSGFAVEITTDGLGYVKDYYQMAAGTGYQGQDENGYSPNFIEITKAVITSNTGSNNALLTYGRLDIVDVSSQLRDKTYEYKFAFEYTDFKGNIVRSQPTESKKLVVPSNRKVVVTCPTSLSSLNDFDTTSTFDTDWQNSTGITLDVEPTNYERAELLKKFEDQTRMRILIYRTKGYYPTKGEVAGQFYQIADIEYGTASFTDFYHDEPNDANAATQYDLVLNPFLAFAEPIKRKDPPPKGKYLTVFKNCLVIAGQNDNVNNVSYSLPKNFITGEIGSEYFPDDDNALVVESPFGSKITAIAALKDLMFVFHKDSIFAVSGNINQLELPTVDLMTKEGGVGCTSQASIEEFNGGLSFVSDTGVYSVSNRGLEELSQAIKPLFLDATFSKQKAISFNWTDKNLLMVCIPDYIVQGDNDYDPLSSESVYISSNSLIIAYDYFRNAWLRWDTLEFTNGIAFLNNTVNFARHTSVGNFTCLISDNGDSDDYSDNGQPINFIYETNWESLGDPTVPKKFLRLKVHSFDTDQQFESNGFQLEAGIQKNYVNINDGKIDFDFAQAAEGGWGDFTWGDGVWGSIPSTQLKSKLPTGKSTSLKIRFFNQQNNQNVLITNYELEIAAPYRQEIKE